MTINDYFCNWIKVIDIDELNGVLSKIKKMNLNTLCPEYKNIFRAFEECSYDNLKCVFLGQDPYPQKGVATGLLFGNDIHRWEQASPSLKVVLRAIGEEVPDDFDYSLKHWANQGILMINSSLTCELNKPGSHSLIWRPFISSLLHNISISNRAIVFVLFGNQAQSFRGSIYPRGNFILEDKHPAYYARLNANMGNDVFVKTRTLLKDYWNYDLDYINPK